MRPSSQVSRRGGGLSDRVAIRGWTLTWLPPADLAMMGRGVLTRWRGHNHVHPFLEILIDVVCGMILL